jgi:hypothetical protein
MRDEVEPLTEQYQFFHWHLAFPDVFRVPTKGETPENETTDGPTASMWCWAIRRGSNSNLRTANFSHLGFQQ